MPRRQDAEDDLTPQEVKKFERQFRQRQARPDAVRLAEAVSSATFKRRLILGLTQAGLADVLEMKQPQVARIESGEVNPSIETLRRLSDRLGIEFTINVRPDGLTVSAKLPD